MVNFYRGGPSSWNRRTDRAYAGSGGPGISVIRNFSNCRRGGKRIPSGVRNAHVPARPSRAHLLLPRLHLIFGGEVWWAGWPSSYRPGGRGAFGASALFSCRVFGRRRARESPAALPFAWRPACTLRMNARPLNTRVSVRGARNTVFRPKSPRSPTPCTAACACFVRVATK